MISHFCFGPSDAEIREEAYRIFCDSDRVNGRELEHWLMAKARLEERASRAPTRQRPDAPLHFPLNAEALCETPHPFPNLNRG